MTSPISPTAARRSVSWVYGGIWGMLTAWFKVPAQPPTLPAVGGHVPISIRPSDRFLDYMRVLFVLAAIWPVLGGLAFDIAITVASPIAGILVAIPLIGLTLFMLLASWVALHVRFDTQWYVLSDRSVRIRRGIWSIRETTITFENVQDITVLQGPLQRHFGIADILLETAGGGAPAGGKGQHVNPHAGFLQGLSNAAEIKELIAARVRASRSAGLGDEHARDVAPAPTVDDRGIEVLRDVLRELRATRPA